jgi:UDP-2,4-diacetamido-2,4,6-trideoxy-beta-L-altropyranose hydrolase
MMEGLIILANASTQIGTGHFMRCLALAQAWKDANGDVTFITACRGEGLLQRLREEEFEIHLLSHPYPDPGDWNHTKDILASHPNAWVVLDGYHFDEAYQQRVKNEGHRLLVIDDMAQLKHYYADIVLNQNLHAQRLHYSCESYTRLLLGTRYVLLRREFLTWRGWKREIPEIAQQVLVTLGGSDSENHTLRVIQIIQKVAVPDLEAIVVVGASNPHADALEAAVKETRIPLHLMHDTKNMPELMAQADIAISGGGATVWELLFFGMPTLILILADNQRFIAEQIEKHGVGENLGWVGDISTKSLAKVITQLSKDYELRTQMSENARKIVDGQGAQRAVSFMRETSNGVLKLRAVRQDDCQMLWEWVNDSVVRAASFFTEPIPWENHVRWFRTKLSDPHCYYYIFLNQEGVPVGQVRFDTLGDKAEISISIASNFRGSDLGAEAIRTASKHLFQETSIARIYAHIKPNNYNSIYAFTKAGYHMDGMKTVNGHRALRMVLNKSKEAFESDPY